MLAITKRYHGKDGDNEVTENLMFSEIHNIIAVWYPWSYTLNRDQSNRV